MTKEWVDQPNPASSDDRPAATLAQPGLAHLAVCLGIPVAVIIAVNLTNWLT